MSLFDLLLDLATPNEVFGHIDRKDLMALTDIACSTLLALCVAKGDTGKLLKAVSSTIITRKLSHQQRVNLPHILIKLQRSVQAVVLGKLGKPNIFTYGIPHDSLIEEFSIDEFNFDALQLTSQPVITSDGKFIYLLVGKALLKVGSGYNGTVKGQVYAANKEFTRDKVAWIGFCNGTLYYKRFKRNSESIQTIDLDSLTVKESVQVSVHPKKDCLLFTDGEAISFISSTNDDTLTVKQVYSTSCFAFDLILRLTKKGFRTLGYANFEEELLTEAQIQEIQNTHNPFVPTTPNDAEIAGIFCGKEFGIAQGSDGKTYYYGKAGAIGLKTVGRSPYLKLNELVISKVSKTMQISLGHEGLHALFLNDDGNVFFAGCAKRGEDGETSKNRRQIKSVKPKKINKLEGHTIVDISCNNGTSAFVTKTGKLIIFGKDTSCCDPFGFVTDLDDQHITKAALGKAHCVAVNSRGEVFTFGLNNKNQCGRILVKQDDEINKSKKLDDDPYNEGKSEKSCSHSSPSCYSCAMKEKAQLAQQNRSDASDAASSTDTPRIVTLKPSKLPLPSVSPVVQISCGLHHTVLLTLNGEVFTFGSNQYGQLGTGDVQPVYCPVQVKITKGKIVQVAAGSNHTVLLTSSGNVITFGKHHKGQLGRLPNEAMRQDPAQSEQLFSQQNIVLTGPKFFWNCNPMEVAGIGPNYGKKASWIGASGDQTFIKTDESLVNAAMLSRFHVAADKNTICKS